MIMNPTPMRTSTAHHRAQVMKNVAPDQFEELIISHISRRIELNDSKLDELMNGVSKTKSSITSLTKASLRRLASPFQATKSKAASEKENSGGLELTSSVVSTVSKLIVSLSSASELRVEGLFRKSGNCARVKELKQKLRDDSSVDLTPYTTHDRATVIKNLLSDISEPLLLSKHFEAFRQAVGLGSNDMETAKQRCLRVMQLLMLHLPRNNLLVARRLLGLLSSVAAEEANKMDSAGLATVFAPHLLCSKQLQSDAVLFNSALSPATAAVKFMIENSSKLFQIPAELIRDVNLFLQSEDRLSDKAGGMCTPVSMSVAGCSSPVSMSLTFSGGSVKDTTEAELAKLHAHIQSLPGCQKRKLSRQLNDVTVFRAAAMSSSSGSQDTPQKYQDTPRKHFRSKSLSSSIKKRLGIFKNKIKHSAEALDLGGTFSAINIDLESTPSNKAMVVDCQPSTVRPSADIDEDVTPPKVAHMEPKLAVTPLASAAPAKDKKRGGVTRTKERPQEDSPLPSTENEREYLLVPSAPGQVPSHHLLSPVQSSSLPGLSTSSSGQETPQRSRGRSWERRSIKSATASSPVRVETSL